MIRLLLLFGTCLALAACGGGGEKGPLPAPQVQAIAYVPQDTPKLTLVSVINNRTGQGGHTALLVTGSQQVLFDPAGSFRHNSITEYGDVLYGMSPRFFQGFKSAHARDSHHVVTQEIPVSPAVAERALSLVQGYGNVGSAFCANSTSSILRQLPGFEDIKVTFFPTNLRDQIALKPGVVTEQYYENDAGDVVEGLAGLDL